MNASSVIFDPASDWPVLWIAGGIVAAILIFAIWRGLKGWALRTLGAAALLLALAGPSLQMEERAPEGDIMLAIVDESASQGLSDRAEQTEAALDALTARVAATEGLELRITRMSDGEDNRGSLLMTTLAEALAEVPRDRVAGMVLISDGRLHDLEAAPDLPAPLHLLRTGREEDWDRRLVVTNAPAFGILDEEQQIGLRIDDMGDADESGLVDLSISIDGGEPEVVQVPTGRELTVPITLTHGGQNVIQFTTPTLEGELTDRNNTAVVTMNGVRDRLRVLLVSGEPHPGTRTWRNLLKSDSAVDLVHFTILRPPEKQDGVPVSELSLIAFPTQELFMEKIDEFDLIIFDRYKLRGILPASYLLSVRNYIEQGGAVLVAAGPDLASAQSLARSPLGQVLPGEPTARVIEEGFSPQISDLGQRHPVTRGLEDFAPEGGWGRWMRLVELEETAGMTVMQGAGDRPLLTLDRVGEGRVALLASDHAWLWDRGFEGGGPQLELLRRLAHWMMKEPELEEEALTAEATGNQVTITRRTMSEGARSVTVTRPDGTEEEVQMEEVAPGLYRSEFASAQIGLFRLEEGDQTSVVAVGPASPKEFEETIASGDPLAPIMAAMRGGTAAIEEGNPQLRSVNAGRAAIGRGWIGYTPRGAYVVENLRVMPLAPPWLMLLIAAGLAVAAWLWEGRARTRKTA
ncbi:putative membrane protein [Maritimibacter alkaliphilus HTCC2654]|uniref:Glutamine amidotransferase domain-containing protein n=1 Tax=Maritimibacter alkaliphilus HTCC2654 TaxID=314271 RepID=A3VC30_9RHOB|nr:membrane protein [Maritimibacter alkaliphilus]EAQ14513.1 hypothetical protein RB2654_17626 [Rhodobacterales bacterium HTCC2654] [Maritimibacter alkaliphilus HTCC2654]TYP82396.1 putative membrane protein [Maritimibacter alkaliphilus HTCC2654]